MVITAVPQETERQPHQIRRFALDYFDALGANVSDEGELARVELNPEQLAELEGRSGPRSPLFYRPEPSLTVLYLAFTPEAAEEDERAELVAPGSFRLSQIQLSARRQGRLGKLTLPPRSGGRVQDEMYRPFFLFHLCITLEGRTRRDRLYEIAVDLVDGHVEPEVARRAARGPLLDETPTRLRKRELGFHRALDTALQHVMSQLQSEDDGWAREALIALAAERRSLERYFTQSVQRPREDAEEESTSDARQLRLDEVEHRCRPKAVARLPLCAMVFAPE